MTKFEVVIQFFIVTLCMYPLTGTSDNKISKEGFAFFKQFPFVVSVQEQGDNHLCGGTLVSMGHVLTTAHCVSLKKENSTLIFPRVAGELSVLSGSIEITTFEMNKQNRTVRGIYLHPGYGYHNRLGKIWFHDMSILELTKVFEKTYFTTTVPFSTRKNAEKDLEKYKRAKAKCLHTGWHSSTDQNRNVIKLKFIKMVLLTDAECDQYICSFGGSDCVSRNVDLMCAVPENSNSSMTDTGAALICRGKFFGLNIHNEDRIDRPKPSIYITTSDVNNFIYLVKDFSCRTTSGYAILFETFILILCYKLI